MRDRMSALSDDDLIDVLTTKAGDYRPEALAIAYEVASSRGGIERMQQQRDRNFELLQQTPSVASLK